ncbi:hypothetical protein D4764_09G0002400 [Takifugu flavidus]|uniref:Reverse transcriptase domain-containing protein n=1 Tax=Takifugu flavidus TaxID=433684 RepID=A0A5C6MLU0_9TELE|nr:hypothetical protein D4764_09G0002400 [Takifugu flavidus]
MVDTRADRYRLAKRVVAATVAEAKTRAWDEFGYPQGGTESDDQEVDHPISGAEVAEVVKQLPGGGAPGADEIRPSRGTTDQLFTLAGVLEGSWEFAQPVQKAYDRVPRGILWGVLQEYGVEGPLIRAVQSLYQRSRSLVRIAGFLLAPSNRDLQQILGRFATKCEAAGMRISTSKSESMVLARKKVEYLLWVGEEVLPQVEEFKYLGILFTSEGRMEREINRRIGAASAVMRALNRSVMVKRELSWKAKLSIYRSIYAPVLTYGHQCWVMTERTRSRIQAP